MSGNTIQVGDTVRLRWGKRTALVIESTGAWVTLDRKLGAGNQRAILWNHNDLAVVKKTEIVVDKRRGYA